MSEDGTLRVSVHGPGASIESALEVAEATKKLLAERLAERLAATETGTR